MEKEKGFKPSSLKVGKTIWTISEDESAKERFYVPSLLRSFTPSFCFA
jgi:hypothetical protein